MPHPPRPRRLPAADVPQSEAAPEPRDEHDTLRALGFPTPVPAPVAATVAAPIPLPISRASRRRLAWQSWRLRRRLASDEGAVTAEYALVIMAAVAFAGLLIVILRSEEVRAMLVSLVQDALGSAG